MKSVTGIRGGGVWKLNETIKICKKEIREMKTEVNILIFEQMNRKRKRKLEMRTKNQTNKFATLLLGFFGFVILKDFSQEFSNLKQTNQTDLQL